MLRSNSNISLDSLEKEYERKSLSKDKVSTENVNTILVPFYENDILMKIPNKKQRQVTNKFIKKNILKEESEHRSYLVNKNAQNSKKTSYLEIFRKQFGSNCNEIQRKDPNEIRSISPEFGDTERESIGEECINNLANEFYNTESYNEIYYEKLLNQEPDQYLDRSFEETLHFNENIDGKYSEDLNDNDLRSISEVSRPRRHLRRSTVPLNQNVHLGGLGPDMENIRPRLERAKSLQRYSEKVRMENRLKIYKKSIEAENEKKAEKASSKKQFGLNQNKCKDPTSNKTTSYLVNNTAQDKSSGFKKKSNSKSKSADVKKLKEGDLQVTNITDNQNSKDKDVKVNRVIERKLKSAKDNVQKYIKTNYTRINSSARNQAIKTNEEQNTDVPPVQISFLVNVGGIRPSSALKNLEEQHRIYQEKVREFNIDSNPV